VTTFEADEIQFAPVSEPTTVLLWGSELRPFPAIVINPRSSFCQKIGGTNNPPLDFPL